MPRIPVYSNTQEVNPQPLGEAAYRIDRMGQIVGASLRGGFNSLAEAAKNMEQHQAIQETSSVSAAGAKAFLDLSQSMDQALSNADPNKIDQAADDWRTKVLQPALDQIGADADTPEGQAAAERVRNSLLTEFSRQSYAAQSTIAGNNVVTNLTATKNGLAQAVANNPAMFPAARDYLQGAVEDQLKAHNMSAEDASRVRSQFAIPAQKDLGVAAFESMAQQNPEAAIKALGTPEFAGLFSGEEIGTLQRYAETQQKMAETQSKADEAETRRQDKEAFTAASSQISASTIQPDGSIALPKNYFQSVAALAKMPGADPSQIRAMISTGQRIVKEQQAGTKATTDPQTYDTLSKQMLSPDGLSDRDIYAARADGHLSDRDTSYLIRASHDLKADPARKEAEQQFQFFLNQQKPAFITKGGVTVSPDGTISMGNDAEGNQRFYAFATAARAQFEDAYSKGTWKAELDPTNSAFLGRMAQGYITNKKGAFPASSLPKITNEADYAKLPKGAQYMAPNGKVMVKR